MEGVAVHFADSCDAVEWRSSGRNRGQRTVSEPDSQHHKHDNDKRTQLNESAIDYQLTASSDQGVE